MFRNVFKWLGLALKFVLYKPIVCAIVSIMQGVNQNMKGIKTMAKANDKLETVKVMLPAEKRPAGQCFSTYLTAGAGTKALASDGKRYAYEICLPVPSTNEEAKAQYGLDIAALVLKGVAKLTTEIDDSVAKPVLFKADKEGNLTQVKASPAEHAKAQDAIMKWKWSAPKPQKSVKVAEMVQALLVKGILTQAQADGIETQKDLMDLLGSL